MNVDELRFPSCFVVQINLYELDSHPTGCIKSFSCTLDRDDMDKQIPTKLKTERKMFLVPVRFNN